jgi:alpha-tubulin suppressor-like RCC1 family protein
MVASLGALAFLVTCKDPTQCSVEVRTDVPFVERFTHGAVATGGDGFAAAFEGPWSADGWVGSLTLVPRTSKDAPLSVVVVLAKGRTQESCLAASGDAKGCIVARRRLSFVSHTPLRVPVVLWNRCDGVRCDEDKTCNKEGACVSSAVDASACSAPDGCILQGDPRPDDPLPPPTNGDAGADAAPGNDGGPADAGVDANSPLAIAQIAAAVNGSHTCALWNDGVVKCWGDNTAGQLGLGDANARGDEPNEMGASLPAVDVGRPDHKVVQLALQSAVTCVRFDDGVVKCWGANGKGELGLGDKVPRGLSPSDMGNALPIVDLGLDVHATAIAAGAENTCAILGDGAVKCWGPNQKGQLGLGDTSPRGSDPMQMGNALPRVNLGTGRTARAICAGLDYACAHLDDGSLKCWGVNDVGQLGQGTPGIHGDAPGTMGDNLPAIDLGAVTIAEVACGTLHVCARLTTNEVKCWGGGGNGNLGYEDSANRGLLPGDMGSALPLVNTGAGKPIAIASGGSHTCARLDDGKVKCWGWNFLGQLGVGDVVDHGAQTGTMGISLPPVDLGGLLKPVRVAVGGAHTCALLEGGRVKCWGGNGFGQLGLGGIENRGDGPGHPMGDALPFVELGRP